MKQTITSSGTSVNQIPRLYRLVEFSPGDTVLDYGCGRYFYDRGNVHDILTSMKVESMGYDPYNQSSETNLRSISWARHTDLTYITCCNVLNVINSDESIEDLLISIHDLMSYDTYALFTVYEGDHSGVGKETSHGYQRNAKAASYKNLLSKVFSSVDIHKVIKCKR